MSDSVHHAKARLEKFCQNIAAGMKQHDAHRKAGYRAASDGAHASHASQLMKRPEVLKRIEEIRAEDAEKAGYSRVELIKLLADVLKAKPSDAHHENPLCELRHVGKDAIPVAVFPDKMAAAARLCKMQGWDAPDKLEVTGKVEVIEFDTDEE